MISKIYIKIVFILLFLLSPYFQLQASDKVFTISAWRTPLNSDGVTSELMMIKIKGDKVIGIKPYYQTPLGKFDNCTPASFHKITEQEKRYPPKVPENYYDNFTHVAKIGAWNYYFILDKTPRIKSVPTDITIGDIEYKVNLENNYATVKKANLKDPNLEFTLPSKIKFEGDVYPVISIGYDAFQYNVLKSLTIPSSVTEIGENAFNNLTVETLKLPSSIRRIGKYAFSKIKKMWRITIPFNFVPYCAFFGCPDLISVIFSSKDFDSVGYDAFLGCPNLKYIYFHTSKPPTCSGSMSYRTVKGERVGLLNQFKSEVDSWWGVKPSYNIEVYIPKGAKKAYKAAEPWKYCKLKAKL